MTLPFWSDGADGDLFAQSDWDRLILDGVAFPGIVEVHATRKHKRDKKSAKGSNGGKTTTSGQELAEPDIKVYLWTQDQWDFWNDTIMPMIWPKPADQPAAKKEIPATTATPSASGSVSGAGSTISTFSAENIASFNANVTGLSRRVLELGGQTVTESAVATEPPADTAKAKAAKKKADAQQPKSFPVFHPALAMLRIASILVLDVSSPKQGRVADEKMIEIKSIEVRAPKKDKKAVNNTPTADFTLAPELQGNASDAPGNVRQGLPSQSAAYMAP